MLSFGALRFARRRASERENKIRNDHNAHATGSKAGARPTERCGILSQIPSRLVQADTPFTSLLRKGVRVEFTPAMEVIVREILAELAVPPILVFPDWDAVADGSRPFHV